MDKKKGEKKEKEEDSRPGEREETSEEVKEMHS